MKPILEVHELAKKYRISHLSSGYLSLRERMVRPFRLQKEESEDFWALRDISFDVYPGESIGIIGRNGAGKSTLLKILSKITPPTRGRIISRGRIASLLEVGTGFHPELTGRENIFFNGSLLGMKRREIETRFDEIVSFSGVEKFLDTPLKHYSSGMQLRLAFSVAAFLEPETLIIDEVLAVGDADFQRKCLGKMEDVSKSGRTILFVSHDLSAVEKLCSRTVLLQAGTIHMIANTSEVVNHYLQKKTPAVTERELTKNVWLTNITFGTGRITSCSTVPISIALSYESKLPVITEFCLIIYTLRGYRVAIIDLRDYFKDFEYTSNQILVRGLILNLNLVQGDYQIGLHFGIDYIVGEVQDIATIAIDDNPQTSIQRYSPQYRGVMELSFKKDS